MSNDRKTFAAVFGVGMVVGFIIGFLMFGVFFTSSVAVPQFPATTVPIVPTVVITEIVTVTVTPMPVRELG